MARLLGAKLHRNFSNTHKGYAGFSLQFFLWESLGLLQPKVEGPEEKRGGPTVRVLNSRRTI